jgi:hypothetical protein
MIKIPDVPLTQSHRKHPELMSLFTTVEGRFLNDEELAEYIRVLPNAKLRADVARIMRTREQEVVEQVVDHIFRDYPFEKFHPLARVKAIRDIRTVAAYTMLAMLMDDPRWLRDKLLLWLRTILQAFRFPDKEAQARKVAFGGQEDSTVKQLKPEQRAIYATYSKLKSRFLEELDETGAALMAPYFQQVTETLSAG